MTPHTQTGGVNIGSLRATAPFASIVVTHSLLSVIVMGKRYDLRKSEVLSLSKTGGMFSKGLRIEHNAPQGESPIFFASFNQGRLFSALQRHGWEVKE